MNFRIARYCLSLIALAPLLTQAQEGFTVTVDEVPPLISNMINPLATVTITETDPTAFDDGYFRLYILPNVELRQAYFTEATVATGSVGSEGAEARGIQLLVHVDADDTAIDSIILDPFAFFRIGLSDFGNMITVRILDGEAGFSEAEYSGDTSGIHVANAVYTLGSGSNLHYLELVTEQVPDIQVGETVSIPLVIDSSIYPPYELTVLTPQTITASIVGDQLVITGISAGTAEFQLFAYPNPNIPIRRYFYSDFFTVTDVTVGPFPGKNPPFDASNFPGQGTPPPFFGGKNFPKDGE